MASIQSGSACVQMLRFQGADIEVALDEGFLFAGKRREPTHEIELELKAGEPAALFEFGLALVDALPLTRSVLSKAKRAAELLSGKPPEPVRSTSPALASDMPAEEAISVLFRSCFSQFLGNLPVLDRGDSIEAVHQMRVAMRRLRSAFGLVYRLSPSAEFDAFRAELKRIGTLLGQARDWDVFVQTIRGGPLPGFADATGFDKFISIAQSRAEAAHGAVARLANDRTVARFALRLDRFVALRGWRGDAQSDPPDWLSRSVVEFAIKSLSRLHRRLLRRGKGFRSQSPGERHALRIAAKHMRYAVEFFGSLLHPHSAERYIDIAQVLQDLPGRSWRTAAQGAPIRTLGRAPNLPSQLARMISDEISGGRFKAGERLPTERELAETFGVSRNVVREAIARLTFEGTVEPRQGSGVFVLGTSAIAALRLDAEMLRDRSLFANLFELRSILEGEAASLAAARTQASDRDKGGAQATRRQSRDAAVGRRRFGVP